MKRNFRLFCTMCLAGSLAIFASSCKKSEEKQFVEVTLPAFEEVIGEPSEADRAYIDFNSGATFHWNGKDNMLVYNLCEDDYTKSLKAVFEAQENAEGEPTGKFWYISGDSWDAKLDHFYMIYPVSRVKDPTARLGWQNREYFVVPRTQSYSFDKNGNPTVDPDAMALVGETYDLTSQVVLNHVFGICRLRLQGTALVDSIKLTGNVAPNDIQNDGLTGEVSLRLNRVDMARFNELVSLYNVANLSNLSSTYFQKWDEYRTYLGYAPNEDGKELVLSCHNAAKGVSGVQLDASNYTPFYFSVRPGAFIYGFDIDVYYHVGTTAGVKSIHNYLNPEGGMKDSYCIKAGTVTGFRPKNGSAYVTIP